MALADYELVLPYSAWKETVDWPSAISAAEGIGKRILQMQERAVYALEGLNPKPTTPEKLAWTVLWVRGFLLLQAALDLRGQYSVLVCDLLYRIAFELWLQVGAIRYPWEQLNALKRDKSRNVIVSDARLDEAWSSVADRLRGFAAWALTNDLNYYRQRSRRWEMEQIYASTDPATLPSEPIERAVHSYVYGDQLMVSTAEAAADKGRAKKRFDAIVARLTEWLGDPAFGEWPALLSSCIRDGSSKVSMLLAPSETGERVCADLAEMCNFALLGLWGMRDHCIQ